MWTYTKILKQNTLRAGYDSGNGRRDALPLAFLIRGTISGRDYLLTQYSIQLITWIRDRGALVQAPDRPVLTMFCDEGSASKLCLHYGPTNGHRWRRLEECVYWTYLDCLYVMTNWDSTLEVARFNLETKEQVCEDKSR
jgi:hypothetical protein